MGNISVTSVGNKYKKLEPRIENIALKLLRTLKKSGFSVDIFLVSNAVMKKINKKYRGKNHVTNVLSFERPKDFIQPGGKNMLGEIYLAPDYIKAKKEDIVYLLIHGFLHLVGFDHIEKSDSIKMRKTEQLLLKKLNSKSQIPNHKQIPNNK